MQPPLAPIVLISGPSGSGKSTLIAEAIKRSPRQLHLAVSLTTRNKRPNEIEGVHYHFCSREEFEKAIANDELLEYAIVHRVHYYGTPKKEVDPYREKGIGVILDIDVQGFSQVHPKYPDLYSIFISTPPGEYERRLRTRESDEEEIKRRLKTAEAEFSFASRYNELLINDDVDRATKVLVDRIEELFQARGFHAR